MRWLVYVLWSVMLAGCAVGGTGSQVRALDEAGLLLEENPQDAFERLNAMDLSEFRDSAVMARWALLYGKAMVANSLYAPADTIIDIAIDYYGGHDCQSEYRQAQWLKAQLSAPSGSESDALTTARYRQKEKEFYLYRERVARERLMSAGVLLLLVAAGVIVWLWQRLRIDRLRAVATMAEVSALKSRILRNEETATDMSAALEELLRQRFALIDGLCATYYESQGTKTERKAVAGKVMSEIESLRSDDNVFAEMERSVDSCRGGVLRYVKAEYPEIKPDDYRLVVYMACGLSYRTVALLMNESVDTLYKRKSRLKGRMRERGLPHWDDISRLF